LIRGLPPIDRLAPLQVAKRAALDGKQAARRFANRAPYIARKAPGVVWPTPAAQRAYGAISGVILFYLKAPFAPCEIRRFDTRAIILAKSSKTNRFDKANKIASFFDILRDIGH
jgi:hypothetical protein